MSEPIPGIETSELPEDNTAITTSFEDDAERLEQDLTREAREYGENGTANAYLARLANIDHGRAVAAEQYARIQKMFDGRERSLEYTKGAEFRAIAEADIASNPKGRFFQYAMGRVQIRAGKDKLVVNDEAAAIQWAKDVEAVEAINTTESIRKTPLMDHFKETGEVPDGCEIIEATDKFYPAVSKRLLPGTQTRGMLEDKP